MNKKLFFLLLLPAVLLTAGYLYVRFSLQSAIRREEKRTGREAPTPDTLGGKTVSAVDLRPLFIQRLQQVLKKSSEGLYKLSVGDLKLDVLASTVSLQKVKLEPDSAILSLLKKSGRLPANVFIASFDSLQIEGINLDDVLSRKTMDYQLVKLVKPVITVHHQKGMVKKEKDTTAKEDFSQRFLTEVEKLAVKKIVIEEGTLTLYNDTKKAAPNVIKKVSVVMNDLLLDSATRKDKNRFLFAGDAAISFRDYSRPTPDGLYTLKLGGVTIKEPQHTVTLTDFSFTSPLSKEAFAKRQKLSKELYNLSLPSVTISNMDWWAVLNEETVAADEIKTTGGKLSIFLDRSLPPKNKMGNFPNQLLMKIPVKMDIGKVAISGLDFSYGEYNPISQQSGTVYMDQVKLTIADVANGQRRNPKPVTVKGTALFMHQVPVEAQFRFDMAAYKTGTFTTHIKMNGFDGSLLNSFTVPMGLMKMEKGTLQGAEATISGNQWKAGGEVYIPYTDLKLSLMEKDRDKTGLDKKHVTSFLANFLLIKNDNPKKGGAPRKEAAEFTRIPEGGFFMLVWKTVLVGALRTIGAPTKIAYKTVSTANKK